MLARDSFHRVASEPASTGIRTAALVVLATAALAAGLYFGRDFFVPIAFAFVLNALLRPIVRRLERLKLPTPLAAAAVVLALTAALVAAGFALAVPLQSAWASAPATFEHAQQKLDRFRKPVQQV